MQSMRDYVSSDERILGTSYEIMTIDNRDGFKRNLSNWILEHNLKPEVLNYNKPHYSGSC